MKIKVILGGKDVEVEVPKVASSWLLVDLCYMVLGEADVSGQAYNYEIRTADGTMFDMNGRFDSLPAAVLAGKEKLFMAPLPGVGG